MHGRAAIWWIRRDLRLFDSPALARALECGGPVVPVFVRDPALLHSRHHGKSVRRQAFLDAGLRALDADLRARGARLIIREGAPETVLPTLVTEAGAGIVIAEGDVSPYARRRDSAVRRVAPLELVGVPMVHHPTDVLKPDGTPYSVFTPFSRAWHARGLPTRSVLLPTPRTLPRVPGRLTSAPIPDTVSPPTFPAGEAEALRRLRRFAHSPKAAIHHYDTDRDRVDLDGTSTLSPYFRFGMVSARAAVVAAREADPEAEGRTGPSVWLSELVWREFYLATLFHRPGVLREAFNASLRQIVWRDAPQDLCAWQDGRTGYPIVDAAMRQLMETGWMPNRARMIVASFLTKDLLIDWRLGEAWFMEQLVDGEPASNNGGWQWTAGVGTDAAPYFRIFNPVLQAKRFDPDGTYVKRWLPVFARVPVPMVHEPWRLGPLEQQAAGCRLGRDYPAPIVDRRAIRERTLAAYRQAQASRD
jgi:deoxyribodipyrimidine photo-lyase